MLRYAITDRLRLTASEPERREAVLNQARKCALAGIDFLQLREKDLPARDLAELARSILAIFAEHNSARPKLLTNSRADIAIAVRADGVHLTSASDELTPAQVRALYSSAGLLPPTVSLSCHTVVEVIAARGSHSENELCFAPNPATAPDLILFGAVFEKRIGDQLVSAGSGLDLLRQACAAAAPIPVLALGGVTDANTFDCLEAGAAGIAAIRLFTS